MSLQTGELVAKTGSPVIDPDTLELAAFFCDGPDYEADRHVILSQDIRQITRDCLIIDSAEEIEEAAEIVRLQATLDRKFSLLGAPVVTELKTRLGKVQDYTVNIETFKVQKIYVQPSLLKNLLRENLIIDRMQITDVTPKQIVVRDATDKAALPAVRAIPE